ncbi:MAG: hypothetical protein IPO92_21415 [Saprospiraceae bacterium]|nr:hypothetical protein [Saprospiraceae bacterium]
MVKQDLLTQSKGIPVLRYALLSLLLVFFTSNVKSQVQIACNGSVQVSLDGDCRAAITPDILIKGIFYLNPPYLIKVSGTGILNNNTNAPIVTKPGLYTATITNGSGNSCWSDLKVEDKLPPLVDCRCPVGNSDPSCVFKCTDEAAFLCWNIDNSSAYCYRKLFQLHNSNFR